MNKQQAFSVFETGQKYMESRYHWRYQFLQGLKNIAILGAITILLIYLIIISSQAAKKKMETIVSQEKSEISQIDEPVVYGYENGAKIWELRSEVARQDKRTESSELTRIYQLILYKGGDENVIIRGDQGTWDKQHEQLILTSNVQVESADGTTTLTTDHLIWQEESKTLSCPAPVDFWVENNHILANSLYSSDDLATIDFIGNVRMFAIGLKGENFITREGDLPIEAIEGEPEGDGIYVISEYMHYDKAEKKCNCLPAIPYKIRVKYNIDEQGLPLKKENPEFIMNPAGLLKDPHYIEALQKSIQTMDLTPEQQDFLAGKTNVLTIEEQTERKSTGFEDLRALAGKIKKGPGATSSEPLVPGQETAIPGQTSPTGPSSMPGSVPPSVPNLHKIPESDSKVVLSEPNYSRIQGWTISPGLKGELFENDQGFDPQNEIRKGKVFCYRNEKKIWCEEVNIDLGEHFIHALRNVDARFLHLEQKNRKPAETAAGKAIQKSPTQMIGNYLSSNWKKNITEGWGRILIVQEEKDIECDNVIYYEDSDAIHAWGNVIARQYSGRWWETSGAIEDVKEKRAKEDVKKPSVIVANALLSYNNKVTWAFGDVVFRQEKQTISADRAQYEDSTEILVMAGSVNYESTEGEKIQCALLTMDLQLEQYIAEGSAIARNKIPEEYKKNLEEFKKDEKKKKPEDDARRRLLEKRTASGLGDWSDEILNPPPLPPIEVLPDAKGKVQPLPPLGPEVPSPGSNVTGPLPGASVISETEQKSAGESEQSVSVDTQDEASEPD